MTVNWQDIVKFLWHSSRMHLRQEDTGYILDFVKRDVPWKDLTMLAVAEGVAGLLYHHLKRPEFVNFVPGSAIRELEEIYFHTKKYCLAYLKEAEALSVRLEQADIPIIILQGLSLITWLYKDPGLRPFGDVDLMVRPLHMQGLKQLLREAGYELPVLEYPDLLYKGNICIDIHTHILNLDRIQNRRYLFPEDLTPMWEKACPLFDQHYGFLVLDPCDNFVALAAHALKHSYSHLIWLCDLHEVLLRLTRGPDGWESVVKRTRFWNQEKVVLYVLLLIEAIFGLKVPETVKTALEIQRLGLFERHLIRLKIRGFSSGQLCTALWLCNITGAVNKLKFIRETIFPRSEIMAQISHDRSQALSGAIYAKRTAETIVMASRDLRRALGFSFKTSRKG